MALSHLKCWGNQYAVVTEAFRSSRHNREWPPLNPAPKYTGQNQSSSPVYKSGGLGSPQGKNLALLPREMEGYCWFKEWEKTSKFKNKHSNFRIVICYILHWTRGWSYTDHGTAHALITWLQMHWSRSYHALITCLSWTEHMADHTLITWLPMHYSRDCKCTDHVVVGNDHVAIMHWSGGWSCTAHVTEHALTT